MGKIKKIAWLIITSLSTCVFSQGAIGIAYSQGPDQSAGVSSIEPSDEYRPDGYYEPYDFSFVKTPIQQQQSQQQPPPEYPAQQQQTQTTPQQQYSSPPAYEPATPQAPTYEPPPITVPEAPDFTGTSGAAPQAATPPVVSTIDLSVMNPQNTAGTGQSPATNQAPAPANAPNSKTPATPTQQASNTRQPNPSAATNDILKFFVKKQKALRYQLKDPDFSGMLDKIASGDMLMDTNWNQILEAVKKYYNEAINNTITAQITDEEFERINSVLYTYICGGAFGAHDSAIVKYKNSYFAFFGPLEKSLQNLNVKNDNSEERYKLLRLLGGDIIKVVSNKLFIFSLKPLSLCVNDIMREVGNGEYYKIEVLFRVMTSADTPVRNLVRPFFQLLKAKVGDAYNSEKNSIIKNNFSRAFEMLNKIQ
ncbi:MAG TPA: hypothetical protein PKK26_04055 [Candidatus Wallbacteria bacterium]|nr:hypothetical protein [Candidatus Wallbacteria bacterium]